MSQGRYPRFFDFGRFLASSPLRFFSRTVLQAASDDLHSPSGPFDSLRIKAFNRLRRLPARLMTAPDCLSLPGFLVYF